MSAFDDPEEPAAGDPVNLSSKTIPPEERLIFALDVPGVEQARRLVTGLREAVRFYKVGLELFLAGGAFELIDWLAGEDKKVFLDLKLYDIPETVARAVRRLRERPVAFLTVHGDGAILEAACREKGNLKILAVTVLTSLDRAGLGDWYVNPKKFPNGLGSLIAHVEKLGMKFGLWVEPEMVNPDSDLYRAHPDWVMHFPGRPRTPGRNQLILNMARDDVKEHMADFKSYWKVDVTPAGWYPKDGQAD